MSSLNCARSRSSGGIAHGSATASLSDGPDSQACVPFHPDAWLLAQPGGAVVQRAGTTVPEARRLRFDGGLRGATARVVEDYNRSHAHPYRWTYTGTPLVRGTPFSQTRRQQRKGHAWFSPRPQQFQRLLYPPRPYNRRPRKLARDLRNRHLALLPKGRLRAYWARMTRIMAPRDALLTTSAT